LGLHLLERTPHTLADPRRFDQTFPAEDVGHSGISSPDDQSPRWYSTEHDPAA